MEPFKFNNNKLYRFNDIVGNTATVSLIKNSLRKGEFPKITYMRGLPGTGKTTTAEIIGMSLTCLNPSDGEPCLECEMCKRNIIALNSGGRSTNLVKYNMGKLNTRKDMLSVVEEVFNLISSSNNNVYILEELHTLNANEQTMLLEEIDRMDRNCHIIICSTEDNKIISPLKSRAIKFDFGKLTRKESSLLIDKTCARLHFEISQEVKKLILEYTRGIPREIVEIIPFIQKSNPSLEEVQDFLHYIPYSEFNELFKSMLISSREASLVLERLMSQYTVESIVPNLRRYAVKAMLYVFGGEGDSFTKEEKSAIKSIFNENTIMALNKQLNTGQKYFDEESLTFLLFNSSMIIRHETLASVYRNNQSKAAKQYEESKRDAVRMDEAIKKSNLENKEKSNILTSSSFDNFFKGK